MLWQHCNIYITDVNSIAQSFCINMQCYADDLQLYIHCRPNEAAVGVARLLSCIAAIDAWMNANRLKMNPDKTQVIWLGSKQQLAAVNITPLHLHDGTVITPSTSVKSLGVTFDSELTMAEHVNNVARSCFVHLRQLRFIRHSLTHESAKLLIHAFISSRVDYCNSVMYGATRQVARKLQAVMNATAQLVTGLGRFDHVTRVLRDELHWLPIKQRVDYKIALLVYKCLHGLGPSYLAEYCTAAPTVLCFAR